MVLWRLGSEGQSKHVKLRVLSIKRRITELRAVTPSLYPPLCDTMHYRNHLIVSTEENIQTKKLMSHPNPSPVTETHATAGPRNSKTF